MLILACAALTLGVAACGGDDNNGTTTTAAGTELTLNGQDTTLALNPATAQVLKENKVKVAPIAPATASDAGISFPITGGQVNSDTLAGKIDHSGGLKFSAGGKDVELTDFVVDTTAGTLTAKTGGADLVTLDLDLTGLGKTTEGDVIVATGITSGLTVEAANALNDAFSVKLFKKGIPMGKVTVRATGS
jgi:hypothetical protein